MADQHNRVCFGVFEIDLQARQVRKCGIRVKMEEQPFEILTALLEKPGELVSRGELRARLWPEGTFVDFDKSLAKGVHKIRTALGDSAATPRFIETLSRRGYRFIAPVTPMEASGTPCTPLRTAHRLRRRIGRQRNHLTGYGGLYGPRPRWHSWRSFRQR
jgi:DNA-binding winged helix-turn-helix (wHTH) protein